MGPFFGHVPNLYTLRGDKIRSAMYVHPLGRPGHRRSPGNTDQRTRVVPRHRRDPDHHDQGARRDGYLRDRTIDGMNSGADVWTLMRDVTLPAELALPRCTGKCRG